VNASVRICADDATERENLARYLSRAPFSMDKIRYDIEDQRIKRAILVHLSLWDEARPPPATPGAVPRAPVELEYLPWVE
jgi:hypothetical protein